MTILLHQYTLTTIVLQSCFPCSGPCLRNPCFHGVSCYNVGNGQFECGTCPEGYEGDGEKCIDINEVCVQFPNRCINFVCTDRKSTSLLTSAEASDTFLLIS